jgi:hypothetical protein
MSDLERTRKDEPEEEPARGPNPASGPNLVLLYSLIALALITAIGIAVLIVLPFYRRN